MSEEIEKPEDMIFLLQQLRTRHENLEKDKTVYCNMLKEENWFGFTNSEDSGYIKNRTGKVAAVRIDESGGRMEISIFFIFPFNDSGDDWQEKGQYLSSDYFTRRYWPLETVTLFKKEV
jgi:hypothetical protein